MKAYLSWTSGPFAEDEQREIPDLAALVALLREQSHPLIVDLREDGDLDIEVYDDWRE